MIPPGVWKGFFRGGQGRKTWKPMTLYELLVVIAIILFLATMMFPAFTHVKEMAKRINCLGKVRDLTLMNQRYAARNNNISASAVYYGPSKIIGQGESYPQRIVQRWQEMLLQDENPKLYLSGSEENNSYSSDYWKMICDNVLHGWNIGDGGWATTHGYKDFWKDYLAPGCDARQKQSPIPYFAIAFYGNFGTNTNGSMQGIPYTFQNSKNSGLTQKPQMGISTVLLLTSIPHPNLRMYLVEHGEDRGNQNAFHTTNFKPYDTQINGQYGTNSPGYIPGYGGGGVGKRSIETIGYASFVQSSKNFGAIKKDVEEGRHDGYTLHGFFDGHAEAVRAEVVGAHQLGPGKTTADLKDMYAPLQTAEE